LRPPLARRKLPAPEVSSDTLGARRIPHDLFSLPSGSPGCFRQQAPIDRGRSGPPSGLLLTLKRLYALGIFWARKRGRNHSIKIHSLLGSLSSAPPPTSPHTSTPRMRKRIPLVDRCHPVAHVTPSWFLTTSTLCSTYGLQVYCNLLPARVRRAAPSSAEPKPCRTGIAKRTPRKKTVGESHCCVQHRLATLMQPGTEVSEKHCPYTLPP
jgi:hypothetical protein